MTSTNVPCQYSLNPAWIDVEAATVAECSRAVKVCRRCPRLRDCALDALHAGDMLDRSVRSPAMGVVQAGVVCRGDQPTADALATIAGVPAPTVTTEAASINRATGDCLNCQRPLHRWTRTPEDIPAGHVMHYARGFCVHCRPAYSKATRHAQDRRVTRLGLQSDRLETDLTNTRIAKIRTAIACRPSRHVPSHCLVCQRLMRPSSTSADGKTVRHEGGGLCVTCHRGVWGTFLARVVDERRARDAELWKHLPRGRFAYARRCRRCRRPMSRARDRGAVGRVEHRSRGLCATCFDVVSRAHLTG